MNSLLQPTPSYRLCSVPRRNGRAAMLSAGVLLALTGCSYLSVPVLRSRATDAPPPIASVTPNGTDQTAAECAQLRSEVRANQQAVREAPTISTSPEIVAAAEAKADKRIDDTRTQLDELDCPPEPDTGDKLRPLAPMPPAPGAASP